MKNWIFAGLMIVLLSVTSLQALAKDKEKAGEKPGQPARVSAQAAPKDAPVQEKDVLIAHINNMRNQELRVAILQQLFNEEIAKLRNVQALFCDRYKLDVDKWRKGLYRYDEKQGKFVE